MTKNFHETASLDREGNLAKRAPPNLVFLSLSFELAQLIFLRDNRYGSLSLLTNVKHVY